MAAAFGRQVPIYLLTFDKSGNCTSPQSASHLIDALAAGRGRDVLSYSHGWNNDFPTAMERYQLFIEGVSALAVGHGDRLPDEFDPVFVGILWPSTALTFGSENAPNIAGDMPRALVDDLAGDDSVEANALLAGAGGGEAKRAERLAEIMAAHIEDPDDAGEHGGRVQGEDLLEAARALAEREGEAGGGSFDDFGSAAEGEANEAQAAGLLGSLDPRWILRAATVLQMKSRAGIVGRGVGPLIRSILSLQHTRLFLIGHSYGAKVVVSALAAEAPPRRAEAVLLLQPAVSRLCFAEDLGDGTEGGFRKILDRVVKPIVTTYSRRDIPLFRIFHLVARRASDVGEVQALGEPSRYAALGGYGPGGCVSGECVNSAFADPPTPYAWPSTPARVVALDGADTIGGHGDVAKRPIFWAMLNLLR